MYYPFNSTFEVSKFNKQIKQDIDVKKIFNILFFLYAGKIFAKAEQGFVIL
jgi:hypothetical protein